MTSTTIPTATRPISLPDLDALPPILARKLRNLPPEQRDTILKGETK